MALVRGEKAGGKEKEQETVRSTIVRISKRKKHKQKRERENKDKNRDKI